MQQVSDALGVLLPVAEPILGESQISKQDGENDHIAVSQPKKEHIEEPPKEVDSTPISPCELRAGSKEFIEITEDEFQSVSALIRGRVKLADVNKVRHLLMRYDLQFLDEFLA